MISLPIEKAVQLFGSGPVAQMLVTWAEQAQQQQAQAESAIRKALCKGVVAAPMLRFLPSPTTAVVT